MEPAFINIYFVIYFDIISAKNSRTLTFNISPIMYVFYSADDSSSKISSLAYRVNTNFTGDTQGENMVHLKYGVIVMYNLQVTFQNKT